MPPWAKDLPGQQMLISSRYRVPRSHKLKDGVVKLRLLEVQRSGAVNRFAAVPAVTGTRTSKSMRDTLWTGRSVQKNNK